MSFTRDIFRLGYEISPIILTGGIASAIPGGMLPIVAITQATDFTLGLLTGSVDINLDDFFAHFKVLPGGTLANNQIGMYPFANQTVAANAIVAQPLNVSLEMLCPANTTGGYLSKLLTITALKQVIDQHNFAGGTYTVATPSYLYTNCVMLGFRDTSDMSTKQVQERWQLDFLQPLISQSDANQVFSSLMSKIAGGLPQTGTPTWSGLASSIGSTVSGAASSVLSSAQNLVGTAVSGVQSGVSSITSAL
jgi:hypothetical protein